MDAPPSTSRSGLWGNNCAVCLRPLYKTLGFNFLSNLFYSGDAKQFLVAMRALDKGENVASHSQICLACCDDLGSSEEWDDVDTMLCDVMEDASPETTEDSAEQENGNVGSCGTQEHSKKSRYAKCDLCTKVLRPGCEMSHWKSCEILNPKDDPHMQSKKPVDEIVQCKKKRRADGNKKFYAKKLNKVLAEPAPKQKKTMMRIDPMWSCGTQEQAIQKKPRYRKCQICSRVFRSFGQSPRVKKDGPYKSFHCCECEGGFSWKTPKDVDADPHVHVEKPAGGNVQCEKKPKDDGNERIRGVTGELNKD